MLNNKKFNKATRVFTLVDEAFSFFMNYFSCSGPNCPIAYLRGSVGWCSKHLWIRRKRSIYSLEYIYSLYDKNVTETLKQSVTLVIWSIRIMTVKEYFRYLSLLFQLYNISFCRAWMPLESTCVCNFENTSILCFTFFHQADTLFMINTCLYSRNGIRTIITFGKKMITVNSHSSE